jgi:hypothetical protein
MEGVETVFLKMPDSDHSCPMVEEKESVDRWQLDEEAAEEVVERSQFRGAALEMATWRVRGNVSPCSTRQLREDWPAHMLLLAAVAAAWS